MNEKNVIITESDGTYQIQNNGISEFALIGILECLLFDLKSNSHQEVVRQNKISDEPNPIAPEPPEKSLETAAPDLRTRIGNAVKAIKGLGGEVELVDVTNATDEELQAELDNLTNQYKRLKKSQGGGK